MLAAARPTSSTSNGRVSWTALISAGSLAIALVGAATAFVQSQINTVKELTANDREAIRRQLSENDRVTESLRHDKLEIARFDQVISRFVQVETQRFDALQKQIDQITARLDAINTRINREHGGK